MTIAIYGSRRLQAYAEPLGLFLEMLARAGADVVMHRKLYDVLIHAMPLRMAAVRKVVATPDFTADVAVSIGGDGTFLRTSMWVGDKHIPILGINAGHLGYLSAADITDLPSLAPVLLSGDFTTECRSLIEVTAPVLGPWPYALNEVAVSKEENSSMIIADTHINGHHLAAYRADGLIISTPTGSTAYNLSVGGPIIQPSAPVWAIAPVAAHSLGMRPLVVSDTSEIAVTVEGRARTCRVSLDGRAASLPIGSTISLRKAPFSIRLVSLPGRTFADRLRDKLHWSE